MFRPVLIILCALALVMGCRTTANYRRPGEPLPPDWQDGQDSPPPPIPRGLEFPPPQVEPVPPPVVPDANRPIYWTNNYARQIWIPIRRWAKDNGFHDLRTTQLANANAFSLSTERGEFVFQPGSLKAYWDGVEIRLGFAPQLAGGEVFLHSLDVHKVVEALARGNAPTTKPGRVIVIDPGHGGRNTGARSVVGGHYEKEFTLDWAFRLAPLLQQRGWRVFLTRTNDVDLSLQDRTAVADVHHADFFLSLHFNVPGNSASEPAGLETYVMTPTGMPSSITRGYPDDLRAVFPNNAHDLENLRYAMKLHRALLGVNGDNDRGIRHARFPGVLRGHNRPAVLIEGGYLSNPKEAQLIALPAYRQRLAEAIARALE